MVVIVGSAAKQEQKRTTILDHFPVLVDDDACVESPMDLTRYVSTDASKTCPSRVAFDGKRTLLSSLAVAQLLRS